MGSQDQGQKPAPFADEVRIHGTRVGWIAGLSSHGRVQVDFDGNRQGPIEARMAVLLDELMLIQAVERRQGAVLCFEEGDPLRPLLLGLIHEPSETPLLDALLLQPSLEGPKTILVDGKKVPLDGFIGDGADELVLRCGKASLVLRRDGQVLLRGTNIQVDAGMLLRLRGGKTQIN